MEALDGALDSQNIPKHKQTSTRTVQVPWQLIRRFPGSCIVVCKAVIRQCLGELVLGERAPVARRDATHLIISTRNTKQSKPTAATTTNRPSSTLSHHPPNQHPHNRQNVRLVLPHRRAPRLYPQLLVLTRISAGAHDGRRPPGRFARGSHHLWRSYTSALCYRQQLWKGRGQEDELVQGC